MPTTKKSLDKKIKELKANIPLEVLQPLTIDPKTEERRETMRELNNKRLALNKKIDQSVAKLEKKDIIEMAKLTGLSIKNTRELLTERKEWKGWKARQVRMIDTVGIVTLKNLITTVNQGRLSPYQAGLMFQMLRGQILRDTKKLDATTSINIGDNRKVNVYYPNFTPKDKQHTINADE
jgi:hypothetical protein